MRTQGCRRSGGGSPRISVALMLMVGSSLLAGAAAQAHAPDGWVATDLIEGNHTTEDAGDAYMMRDGDTVSVHWHLTGDFAGAEVTNQFVCAGSYEISPANQRCKPGQAPDGTVFSPSPIGADDWCFTYTGDATDFQIHISINCEAGRASSATGRTRASRTTTVLGPARPTTARPTTARPTTARPTTAPPTTARPTTARPTTARPTTARRRRHDRRRHDRRRHDRGRHDRRRHDRRSLTTTRLSKAT